MVDFNSQNNRETSVSYFFRDKRAVLKQSKASEILKLAKLAKIRWP